MDSEMGRICRACPGKECRLADAPPPAPAFMLSGAAVNYIDHQRHVERIRFSAVLLFSARAGGLCAGQLGRHHGRINFSNCRNGIFCAVLNFANTSPPSQPGIKIGFNWTKTRWMFIEKLAEPDALAYPADPWPCWRCWLLSAHRWRDVSPWSIWSSFGVDGFSCDHRRRMAGARPACFVSCRARTRSAASAGHKRRTKLAYHRQMTSEHGIQPAEQKRPT